MSLSLAITPSGHLHVEDGAQEQPSLAEATAPALRHAFDQSSAEGLLLLATAELERELPAEFVFWRGFAREFFQRLCQLEPCLF